MDRSDVALSTKFLSSFHQNSISNDVHNFDLTVSRSSRIIYRSRAPQACRNRRPNIMTSIWGRASLIAQHRANAYFLATNKSAWILRPHTDAIPASSLVQPLRRSGTRLCQNRHPPTTNAMRSHLYLSLSRKLAGYRF